ncbi:MAG: rRNA adenine N-6-methyltransferase family protein, partial [Candidatus Magasanikbacteria bacterium]
MPNKVLGQHFLQDQTVIAEIIKTLAIEDGDTVIEIGPGHGEITERLIKNNEIKYLGVEKDQKLAGK